MSYFTPYTANATLTRKPQITVGRPLRQNQAAKYLHSSIRTRRRDHPLSEHPRRMAQGKTSRIMDRQLRSDRQRLLRCSRLRKNVNMFHFAVAKLGLASLWIDYVPSESNPADVPSRLHEMSPDEASKDLEGFGGREGGGKVGARRTNKLCHRRPPSRARQRA